LIQNNHRGARAKPKRREIQAFLVAPLRLAYERTKTEFIVWLRRARLRLGSGALSLVLSLAEQRRTDKKTGANWSTPVVNEHFKNEKPKVL
jgi:hypothetical protein